MRAPLRRAELERLLAQVPAPPHPKPELEQYRTPDEVASDLLLRAAADGAIVDRNVLDLGCGTGVLAIGAALLGARLAAGVDADPECVQVAASAAAAAGVGTRTWFVAARIPDWHADPGTFDTVVMNPPFGAQAANRHADRTFLEHALDAVAGRKGSVWFLAQERTAGFLQAFATERGARLERVARWDYPLMATMAHHREEARVVGVAGYRLSGGQSSVPS